MVCSKQSNTTQLCENIDDYECVNRFSNLPTNLPLEVPGLKPMYATFLCGDAFLYQGAEVGRDGFSPRTRCQNHEEYFAAAETVVLQFSLPRQTCNGYNMVTSDETFMAGLLRGERMGPQLTRRSPCIRRHNLHERTYLSGTEATSEV